MSRDEPTDDAEVEALRALLDALPVQGRSSEPIAPPVVPFAPLPPLEPNARRALEAQALAANEQYLSAFIEPHSFCPFSRGGRAQGITARFVHYADSDDPEVFLAWIERAASDPAKAVIQLILPMVDVGAAEFSRFCHELTIAGNARLRRGRTSPGLDVFAVAPLHPELPYSEDNAYTLIPLLRRAPDPTIQWVRLDALEVLYAGRSGDTRFIDPRDIEAIQRESARQPLFDRIAETNLQMVRRLGVAEVERTLRAQAREARARYTRVLVEDAAGPAPVPCPRAADACGPDRPPLTAATERADGTWALCRLADLLPRKPRCFSVAGAELVAVRVGRDVHVLHGRCPHRFASFADAIIEDERLVCGRHGWDFRLDTGQSEGVPGASVRRFEVLLREGYVCVDGAEIAAWRRSYVEPWHEDDVLS